jgi:voltage-gated potassium channel Kch
VVIVVLGGILIRLVDHKEYASVWVGMWYALQTVTTVGYGDVTPKEPIGRIIGSFIMLEGIAFVTIFTAAVTATFVARAQREGGQEVAEDEAAAEAGLDARLDDLAARLDRVESLLRNLARN